MHLELMEYRRHLLLAEQKAVEDYGKTVLHLSGGALGVSFAFLKDVVGPGPWTNAPLLFWAWIFWGLSVAAVLCSYYFSHVALRRAITQVDQGKVYSGKLGGCATVLTHVCNIIGGVGFLTGVVLIAVFVLVNLWG